MPGMPASAPRHPMEVAAALAFAKLPLDDVEILTDTGPVVFAGR